MWPFQSMSITPGALANFKKHAESTKEVCGVMIGARDNYTATVDEIHIIANISKYPEIEFLMSPSDFIEAIQKTSMWDKENPRLKDYVGIIHSHPRDHAFPSIRDWHSAKQHELVYGGYVIYSPRFGELNAFYWNGHEFRQVGLP